MSFKSNDTKYGKLAILFHWLSALLIIVTIPLGKYMHALEQGADKALFYKIHIFIGLSILALTLARIIWRFFDNTPSPVKGASKNVIWASKLTHLSIIATLLLTIFSGMAYNLQSGLMSMLLSGEINWPNTSEFLAIEIHEIMAMLFVILTILHIAAAIWHQHILKDNILARMK